MSLRKMEIWLAKIKQRTHGGLREKLLREGKTRWLEIGNGGRFDDGFYYLDWLPCSNPAFQSRYHQASILDLKDSDLDKLGSFDLIRMQHVFEHFSFEEGHEVLNNCARMLRPSGYLLMSVPDLRLFAKAYLAESFNGQFVKFARKRIPADAPASCYFSVFAQSFAHILDGRRIADEHKWCYDFEGLEYQVRRTDAFKNIKSLGILNPLASIFFTHNRPDEDVCLLAQKR